MGKTAQWILDARKAKKRAKLAEATVLSADPVKRRTKIKAAKRSAAAKPRQKKHGKPA